jgi:prepilin-type N-terminal cleavage/methylation domain-containing protein
MTRRGAFTLIEVLVALALTAALAGAVLAFLDTLSTRRAALERAADHTTGVGLLFDQVERAALACVADADGLPGIVGTREGLTIAWRGVGAGGSGDGA